MADEERVLYVSTHSVDGRDLRSWKLTLKASGPRVWLDRLLEQLGVDAEQIILRPSEATVDLPQSALHLELRFRQRYHDWDRSYQELEIECDTSERISDASFVALAGKLGFAYGEDDADEEQLARGFDDPEWQPYKLHMITVPTRATDESEKVEAAFFRDYRKDEELLAPPTQDLWLTCPECASIYFDVWISGKEPEILAWIKGPDGGGYLQTASVADDELERFGANAWGSTSGIEALKPADEDDWHLVVCNKCGWERAWWSPFNWQPPTQQQRTGGQSRKPKDGAS